MTSYNIILNIAKLPEGYYLATSEDVQGLVAQAKTFEETVEIAKDLAKELLVAQETKDYYPINKIIYPVTVGV
jgi:predicted RNase H-like HicB family nuclease